MDTERNKREGVWQKIASRPTGIYWNWFLLFHYNLMVFPTFVPPAQARNIAVCIEFRDSDEDEAQPLKVHLHISSFKPFI